jgi:hypothetical protein
MGEPFPLPPTHVIEVRMHAMRAPVGSVIMDLQLGDNHYVQSMHVPCVWAFGMSVQHMRLVRGVVICPRATNPSITRGRGCGWYCLAPRVRYGLVLIPLAR